MPILVQLGMDSFRAVPQETSFLYIENMGNMRVGIGRTSILALVALLSMLAAMPVRLPAQTPLALTTSRQIRSLRDEEAARGSAVRLRGVVTALHSYVTSFFLADSTGGIFVKCSIDSLRVQPGQEVEVNGRVDKGSFAPLVLADSVKVIGRGKLPTPRVFRWEELADGKLDSQWGELRGVIRSVSTETRYGRPMVVLKVELSIGNSILAYVTDFSTAKVDGLRGATVRISGVAGSVFNDRRQFLGPKWFVSNLGAIVVERPAPTRLFDLPLRSLDSLLRFDATQDTERQVRVHGIVTLAQPGDSFFIQDGRSAVFVRSQQQTPLALGMEVEVVGYPAPGRYSPILDDAVFRVLGQKEQVLPLHEPASAMVVVNQYGFSVVPFELLLVELHGRLLEDVSGPGEDQLILQDGDRVFTARLPRSNGSLPPLLAGSLLRLTGTCVAKMDESHEEAHEAQTFEVLLRSPADIEVVGKISWWNAKHAGWVVAAFLVLVLAGAGFWAAVRRHAELQALAMSDPLTGLLNRRGFFMLAEHAWYLALRKKSPLLLFYFDVDLFKEINDSFGHREGDHALQEVAALLRETFRHADILARMGGDEFAVLCDAQPNSQTRIEDRIASLVRTRNQRENSKFQLSLSIGMMVCDDSLRDLTIGDLLTRADALMYEKKRESRSRAIIA